MKIKMLILALSGGLLVSALAQGATEVDGIAAIVNNKVITKGEVRSAAQTQVRILVMNDNNQVRSQAALEARVNEIEENALRDLVDRELILDEFESLGATIRQQHIEDAVSRFIQERFSGDRKQFAKELDRSGLSLKQFRDMQRETIIVQAMRSRNAGADDSIVTPFEREKFWEENQELFASDGFVKLRTITIPKITDNNAATAESQKKLVNEILTKLRGGADFGTMARTYSVDSGAKENGVRGTFSRSDLNSQLATPPSRLISVSRMFLRSIILSTKPCSIMNSAVWKPGGRFWCVVSLTTRGPANPIMHFGSAIMTSPKVAKLAVTPPVVGWVSTAM